MEAVSDEDVEGIRRLANPDNIDKTYDNPRSSIKGWTLLQQASYRKSVDSIKAQLRKGAEVNLENQGFNALHIVTTLNQVLARI